MSRPPTIVALWLDGDSCEVAARESWALTPAERDRIYRAARESGLGACVVSTCYRVELLLSGREAGADLQAWGREQLAEARPDLSASAFHAASDDDALRHIFRVAAGLESAVLGEAQILGQVRRARADAEAAGALSPELRESLDAAVRAGQWARRVTDLGRGTASTASAAIQWADAAVDGLEGRRVVVAGAGQIGRLLLELLAGARPASLTLVSAHAPAHPGFDVVRPEALPDLLPTTDIVFAATDRPVLDGPTARSAWGDGARRAVVDLGVPRNVDESVGRIPGVALADVDALGAVVDAGLAARRAAIPDVEACLDDALAVLRERLTTLDRERLVADFRRRAETIRQETLAYVCDRCSDRTCIPDDAPLAARPGPGPCSDPEGLSRTLTTRLLHDVTAALRSGAGDDDTLRQLLALDADG